MTEAAATGPAAPPEWFPRGPADLVASPLKAAGLSPLEADPGGIAPPAGSRRLGGVQRRLSGQVEQQARYECPVDAEAAGGHYRSELQARGFRLHKDLVEPAGRRMLVFWKDSAYATVALRKDRRQDKMVMVVLTVVTLGASAGPR